MKHFLKKLLITIGIIIITSTTTNFLTPTSTYAYGESCRNFLGMTSWDCGVVENVSSEDDLKSNVLVIASNVFVDLTVIAAYLVIGYVIYGGYQYIFASGDTGKVMAGKKTLIHAFIGLAIVMLAHIILSAIRIALIGDKSLADCTINGGCITPGELVTNAIQWIIGISGLVSAIFIVVGGVGYMTSAGDPGKLKKAKDTIMYALIGLAIVGLAEVITAFVSNTIRDAETASNSTTIIAKEINHEN